MFENPLVECAPEHPNGQEPAVAGIDQQRIAAAVREILVAIGEDPTREGLRDTPTRVARSYAEMFAGLRQDPRRSLATTFDEGHAGFVLVKNIEVQSTCEHHLLPIHGVAHVGYLPGPAGRIVGLSKIARLVDGYARRPQVQERLTAQIADALMTVLEPAGVVVVIEGEHMCMTSRGVRKPRSTTVTSVSRGVLDDDRVARQEALQHLLGSHA